MKNILIISAHPDDLEMSCGGSVAKWVSEGHNVVNLILVSDVKQIDSLGFAREHLGYEAILWPGDRGSLSVNSDMIADIEAHFVDVDFDRIVTHWREDWHQDHQVCHNLGRVLARKQPTELWYMSSHPYHLKYREFSPDIYVDVSEHAHLKYKAITEYDNLPGYWETGVRSHDSWRGTFIHAKKAEVFMAGNLLG
jgi:LmbE family N-acetylglucosaminyl deacetylase